MKSILSLLALVAFFGMTSCDATMTTTIPKPRPDKEVSKPKSPPEKNSPQNINSVKEKPEQTVENH